MSREVYEAGDSLQFTFVSSVAPDGAPSFAIYGPNDTLVSSQTAVNSSSTAYYAMATMPNSLGTHVGEWKATKTVDGTAYPFVKRFIFNVQRTSRNE